MTNKLKRVIELEQAYVDALDAKRRAGESDTSLEVQRLNLLQNDLCVDIERIEQWCDEVLRRYSLT